MGGHVARMGAIRGNIDVYARTLLKLILRKWVGFSSVKILSSFTLVGAQQYSFGFTEQLRDSFSSRSQIQGLNWLRILCSGGFCLCVCCIFLLS